MAKKFLPREKKIFGLAFATAAILMLFYLVFRSANFAVLNPRGDIARQQVELIINATLLMLIVIIPVFILTFYISWKYRASNKKAKYSPDWDGNRLIEATWWLIPLAIVAALAVMIWQSSHKLDPYRSLASPKKPVRVQVVALQWRWLFIYPDQNIVTVNYLQIPVDTPISLQLTSDAPMNSFWVPQLAGQIYAMPGMSTKLNLNATSEGEYQGSSANISGEGFAGMRFKVKAVSEKDFAGWAASTGGSAEGMDFTKYSELSKPSKDTKPVSYKEADQNLYDKIIMKYMAPPKSDHQMNMKGMKM